MNTPRPTPRTDALANTAWEGASDDYSAYAKMLHHAHTLETELADALEKIIRIKKSHEETERDEIESMREVIMAEAVRRHAINNECERLVW